MSWEEDFLMRRVGEITSVLKGLDMLEECANCTTLYAADLDACPNCGHPKGEPKSRAMEGERPTPLGGVESTAGANALPPQTVHGGANPNAVVEAESDDTESVTPDADDTAGEPDADAPQETLKGEPASYEEANVETLRAELTEERRVFVPSGQRKADLIRLLRENDRDRAAEQQG